MPETPSGDNPSLDTLSSPFIFVPDGDPLPAAWLAQHPGAIRLRANFVPHRSNLPPGGTQTRQLFDPIAPLARVGRGLEREDPVAAYLRLNDSMTRMGYRFADGPGSSLVSDKPTAAAEEAEPPSQIVQATQPALLSDAAAGAGAPRSYVDPNPRRWNGRSSVGSGECVALVQQATGAPRTAQWRQGEQVKGNPDIAPGTAIATFDGNGRYGNHTDGTSHAAIYLGQGPEGIYVIDQWNIWENSHISLQHTPQKRTIYFNHTGHSWVDQGENYFIINE